MSLQFLYRIQPTRLGMLTDGPTERERAIIGEHFAYLSRLVDDGRVFMAGRTLDADERSFGIVVFNAETREDAAALMHGDPAVQHGVMSAELFPYRVALWSSQRPADR